MSVLWDALNNIDKITISLLILSLSIALFYEMINGFTFSQSVNWKVVYGILTALALSPLFGFGLSYLLMKSSRKTIKHPKFYRVPSGNKKKKPNFWNENRNNSYGCWC